MAAKLRRSSKSNLTDGDRTTEFSKKRRLLRNHRMNMRIMQEVIDGHGLASTLEERLIDETGNNNFWLGEDSDMDADSDQEDPEAVAKQQVIALLQESDDRKSLIDAVASTLECRAMATDLERARMQLEDIRSQSLR